MRKKVALVTGGSRGIGLAICEALNKEGIKVFSPSREELNLLSNSNIENYLDSLRSPIDILVNNAGVNLLASIEELDDANIDETFQVNLLAPLKLIREISVMMKKQKYGRIINIGSIWGSISKPRRVTYTITKSGLEGLTRSLAIELAPYNILVNCVAPGYVNTSLTRKNNTAKQLSEIKKSIPLHRLAQPDEIAGLVAFLASEKNNYITGQTIIIDGGFLCAR